MRKSTSERRRSLALHAVMTPLALVWLFPLWVMFVFSTMDDNGIFSPGIVLTPSDKFVENFVVLERDVGFIRATTISFVVAFVYTLLSVALTSMAGWALASYRFVGKRVVVARDFNLDNTWFALIVPPLFNSLGVLFTRQTFQMMPQELFDAARVEGVKEWRIFLFVALPLARPTLAALSIILFLHSWNNYLWPLLINSQPSMMTAPVALGSLIGLTKVSWGGIMTGAVILTAPMLVLFVALQRHFVAGISAGAVK
jgi:lactose/L-arabinose transport system permease protein